LCIPQHCEDDPDSQKIKDQEIDKQGEIFKNAEFAAVWMNNIDNWEGLKVAVLWFAAKFMQLSRSQRNESEQSERETAVLGDLLQNFETQANEIQSGLLQNYVYSGHQSFQSADLCGWFSSLWTLQEVCLRPDMLLFDRNWREFVVGPQNFRVTLDNLLAMAAAFDQHKYRMDTVVFKEEDLQSLPSGRIDVLDGSDNENSALRTFLQGSDPLPEGEALRLPEMPCAAAELHYILSRLEMSQILDSKPLTILALGNQRYCEENRAVAIMSVIGAKKWYKALPVNGSGVRMNVDKDLVLGTYPLAFVEEVRARLGVEFFRSTGSGSEVCRSHVFTAKKEGVERKIRPVGSMMPFSARKWNDYIEAGKGEPTADERRMHTIAERLRNDRPQPRAASTSPFSAYATDHPSVRTWKIMPDGTTEIFQAAIFASHTPDKEPQTRQSRLRARITVHSCAEGTTVRDELLQNFLGRDSPEYRKYAVLLSHGKFSRYFSGIIVQEVLESHLFERQLLTGVLKGIVGYHVPTKLLVRIGTWTLWDVAMMTDEDVPVVREVDWRVL
jgi:hypothetical protein